MPPETEQDFRPKTKHQTEHLYLTQFCCSNYNTTDTLSQLSDIHKMFGITVIYITLISLLWVPKPKLKMLACNCSQQLVVHTTQSRTGWAFNALSCKHIVIATNNALSECTRWKSEIQTLCRNISGARKIMSHPWVVQLDVNVQKQTKNDTINFCQLQQHQTNIEQSTDRNCSKIIQSRMI